MDDLKDAAHGRRLQKQKELFPAIKKFVTDDALTARHEAAKAANAAKTAKTGTSLRRAVASGAIGIVAAPL